MEITKLENEIWHEIDQKNELKSKIKHLETIYKTIRDENDKYSKKYNGLKISELSRLAGPLFQTIGHFKRELNSMNPEKAHVI